MNALRRRQFDSSPKGASWHGDDVERDTPTSVMKEATRETVQKIKKIFEDGSQKDSEERPSK